MIPPTESELMGIHRRKRKGDDSLCLRVFPKDNIILTHYMIRTWWLQFLEGIGHYVIRTGEVAHIVVTTNNIMILGYTYVKRKTAPPPDFF